MVLDRNDGRTLTAGIELPGRVAVSWAVGGGVVAGGFLVAAMALAGRLSGHALLVTSTGLFVVGATLGFVHGAVLGFLGRPVDMGVERALGRIGLAAIYTVPALLIGWLVAGWIAMTSVAVWTEKTLALVGVGAAWIAGAALVGFAAMQGWRAVRGAYARWPDRRLGTLLVAALFGGLLAVFLKERPELWGMHVQVTTVGAVLLAAAATLWLAGPVVTVALAVRERLPGERPAVGFAGRGGAVASVGAALVTGIGLALLALPFYGAAYGVQTGGAAGVVTTALVDEVLLRLFLVTGAAWLMIREFKLERRQAAALAVAAAAGVQVLVYLPGVLAIGFPNALTAVAFVALTVIVPAVAFGALYWRRGFGTALLAHAATLGALLVLVGR
jgi:hypothetical protein